MSRRCRRCDHVADTGNRDDDLAAAQAHARSAQHWMHESQPMPIKERWEPHDRVQGA